MSRWSGACHQVPRAVCSKKGRIHLRRPTSHRHFSLAKRAADHRFRIGGTPGSTGSGPPVSVKADQATRAFMRPSMFRPERCERALHDSMRLAKDAADNQGFAGTRLTMPELAKGRFCDGSTMTRGGVPAFSPRCAALGCMRYKGSTINVLKLECTTDASIGLDICLCICCDSRSADDCAIGVSDAAG